MKHKNTYSECYGVRIQNPGTLIRTGNIGFCFRYNDRWYLVFPFLGPRNLVDLINRKRINNVNNALKIFDITKLSIEKRRYYFYYNNDLTNVYDFTNGIMKFIAEFIVNNISKLTILTNI